MTKRTIQVDLTDDGIARVDRMAAALGGTREDVLDRAIDLFAACVGEVVQGRVIGVDRTPPEHATFHDWNVGGYRSQPHRILMSPAELAPRAA